MRHKVNVAHLLVALAVGAFVWHMYVTRTAKGQQKVRRSSGG